MFLCIMNIGPIKTFLLKHREWMTKVDRMRSRNADVQEGWKEGEEERRDSKSSWAESGDPRAPSPGNIVHYNKTVPPQDQQV